MTTIVPQDAQFSRRQILAFGQFYPGGEVIPVGTCMTVDAFPDPQLGKEPELMGGILAQRANEDDDELTG